MDKEDARESLVNILQLVYSGELAAAYAYRGHWQSVQEPEERSRIQSIEEEEWHHRRLVGDMLQQLEERPDTWRVGRSRMGA
jgi:demethoxyubiquinone hydroxylase (CLK1/Coq7/Cat5 family)